MDIFPFFEVDDLQLFLSEGKKIDFETFSSISFSLQANVNFNSELQTDIFDEQLLSYLLSTLAQCKYFDGESFKSTNFNTKLSLLSCNINSFHKNFDNFFSSYINDSNLRPTIFSFCETKLSPEIEVLYSIPNYKLIFNSRNTRGGGLLLAINDEIKFEKLEDFCLMLDHIETLFVKIFIDNQSYVIGTVYRPPNSNIIQFFESYRYLLEHIKDEKCYLSGDYNLDLLQYDKKPNVRTFVDLSMEFCFLPLISKPTRVTDHSATLIDHFWTNNLVEEVASGVLLSDASDHFAPFIWMNSPSTNDRLPDKNSISYRQWKNLECEEFDSYLYEKLVNLESHIGFNSNHDVQNLSSAISDAINKFCPLKTKKGTNLKNKPWFTSDLKSMCKEKNSIHKKYLKRPITFGAEYRRIRNSLNNLLKSRKKQYYKNLLFKYRNDCKKTWNVLNELLGRTKCDSLCTLEIDGEISENKELISNKFNNYFANVTTEIVRSLPTSNVSFTQFLHGNYPSSFVLNQTTPAGIEKIIRNLNSTGGGYPDIPAKVFKNSSTLLSEPISFLLNKCIESGCYPDCLKIAKIIPLFKAKNKLNVRNYRPISLLPVISKIFERHIYNELISYVESEKILSCEQSGFRKESSTNIAIAKLLNQIIEGIEAKKLGLCVFLDLQKAFDMVDHNILLEKLQFYGIRGTPLKILESFLHNRKQYVYVNGTPSHFSDIIRGVPQGSVLSGLLFLLFINDIVNCSNIVHFNLFADDTSIYLQEKNIDDLYQIMNRELIKVNVWLCANKLSLNVEKTIYLLFCGKKRIRETPPLFMFNSEIERKENTKFLGIFLDEKLSWKKHANHIVGKLSRIVGVFAKIQENLSISALKTLYFSFFQSNLQYGIFFWYYVSTDIRNKIMRLQKKAIRIISKNSFNSHTNELFNQLKILKFEDLMKLESCKFIYQEVNFSRNFSLISHSYLHNYPTRSRFNLLPQFQRTRVGSKFVLSNGINLYNGLDENVKNIDKMCNFKCKLKLDILSTYS